MLGSPPPDSPRSLEPTVVDGVKAMFRLLRLKSKVVAVWRSIRDALSCHSAEMPECCTDVALTFDP